MTTNKQQYDQGLSNFKFKIMKKTVFKSLTREELLTINGGLLGGITDPNLDEDGEKITDPDLDGDGEKSPNYCLIAR